ncbi:heme biosynthesis protein HemY [Yoonia sp. 208BN28-4]|uniref:heme biosynthesis protein HemY n=1 Tax=Yoonia sp. 208BN28-4 TaxID=3126505 RepID=UPI00309D0FD2
MLWSLIKILAFVAVITALTFGATMLMNVDGGAVIAIGGVELSLGLLELVFAFVALVVLVWLALKILSFLVAAFHFLNGDETAISRYWDRNRERKGYEALSEGMMALASGEGHLAMTKAARADKYLEQPQLTTLLTAQAAEMTGDRKKAEASYKKLLEDDKTRFVGVRGIMKQKLEDGDTDTALKLAEKAFALKPKHEDTQDVLLRLQAEKADWTGARTTLNAKLKSGALPRDVHKRRDAVLALSEARDVAKEGTSIESREAAIEANRLSPDLIPAAVMAARSYIEDDNGRYAARVLTKAWSARPHPDLAAAFAEIAPDETPQERLKRFRALTKLNTDNPETKMLLAELHIAAEDFPQARRDITELVTTDPTARSLTIMAAVERGEGADDAVVRGWLTRALTAPRGPQWVCDNCQHIHGAWAPICSNCSSFDTLSWKRPVETDVAMPAGTEMLPLIVGQIEDNSASDDASDDVTDAEVVDASNDK